VTDLVSLSVSSNVSLCEMFAWYLVLLLNRWDGLLEKWLNELGKKGIKTDCWIAWPITVFVAYAEVTCNSVCHSGYVYGSVCLLVGLSVRGFTETSRDEFMELFWKNRPGDNPASSRSGWGVKIVIGCGLSLNLWSGQLVFIKISSAEIWTAKRDESMTVQLLAIFESNGA